MLGHDKDNLLRGVGVPHSDVLYDTQLFAPSAELHLLRLELGDRPATKSIAVDTPLLAT